MQARPLIVPIHLSALPMLPGSVPLRSLQLSMLKLEQWNAVSSRQQESASIKVAKPAVLLHWVLPEAYKQGLHGAKGLDFPAVPNRWLVVRTHRVGTQVSLKKWVVESDYWTEGTTGSENNYLMETADGMHIVKLGRKVELQDDVPYQEAGAQNYLPYPLTAVPGWDPAFAAKFGSAENVFGLRDEFEGKALPAMPDLCYQVYGWHAKAGQDLLATALAQHEGPSADALRDFLAAKGWEYARSGDDPETIICHGCLLGVDVSGKATSRIPVQTQVYVAQSAVEVAGTYLSHQAVMQQRWADLLDQYQYATIQEQGWPFDPKSYLQQRQHDHGFQAVGRGTYYTIQVRNRDGQPLAPDEKPVPFDFPPALSAQLRELNRQQRVLERLQASKDALAHDLYARLLIARIPAIEKPESLEPTRFAVDEKPLEQAAAALDVAQAQLDALIALLKRDLAAASAAQDSLVNLDLVMVADQQYWRPNEPTVLITGLRPSEAYLKGGPLRVRGLQHLARSLVYGDRTLALPPTKALQGLGPAFPEAAIQALWQESQLFNPPYFEALAEAMAQQTGIAADDLLHALQANAEAWSRPAGGFLWPQASLPHHFEYLRWQMPWVPMYMDWEIEFAFGAHADDGRGQFNGRCLLSGALVPQIAEIERVLGMPPSTDTPLFQELSGLSDQFLSRLDGLQLPLFVQKAAGDKSRSYRRLTGAQATLLGMEHPWGPLTKSGIYSLARAGGYRFKNITVVDAFGQWVKVQDEKMPPPIISHRMRIDAQTRQIETPLRLNFGARLKLDWIDARSQPATDYSHADPATSPIFGWLVLQQDRELLLVYGSNGMEIGALSVQGGKVVWHAPAPDTKRLMPEHAALDSWLRTMLARPAAQLETLMAGIAAYTAQVRKPSSKASRWEASWMPTGLPLALARLHCTLEQQEPTGHNYRFEPDEHLGVSSLIALESLLFPFTLGNDRDGVLYYTLDQAWGWMQAGKSYLSHDIPPTSNFTLQFDRQHNQALVYVLLDPQKPVEIHSSILPTQTAQLDEAYVKRGLATMEHQVHIQPLLTPRATVSAPLPDLPGTRWAWTATDRDGAVTTGEVEIDKTQRATFEPIVAKDILFKIIQEDPS